MIIKESYKKNMKKLLVILSMCLFVGGYVSSTNVIAQENDVKSSNKESDLPVINIQNLNNVKLPDKFINKVNSNNRDATGTHSVWTKIGNYTLKTTNRVHPRVSTWTKGVDRYYLSDSPTSSINVSLSVGYGYFTVSIAGVSNSIALKSIPVDSTRFHKLWVYLTVEVQPWKVEIRDNATNRVLSTSTKYTHFTHAIEYRPVYK